MFTLQITPENRILVETVLLLLFTLASVALAHPRRQPARTDAHFRIDSRHQPVAGD